MSVLVRIHRPACEGGILAELNVKATSLQQVIDQLSSQDEKFKTRLLDESGNLHRFINVYVNEEDVRFLQKLETPIKDGDEVAFLPAISGGC